MKRTIAVLLSVSLLLIMPGCSSKQPSEQGADHQAHFSMTAETQDGTTAETEVSTDNMASENETTPEPNLQKPDASSEPTAELPNQSKEDEPMKETQFYITANNMTFTANFADNASAAAFRELLRKGNLTINMSDYGSFEKVGSIGTSLPRKDTQISTATGDVMLYQGNQIVIFYGTNSWSYSRLGRIEGATAETLLSAFGSGDVIITFSLTKPQ